MVKRMYHIEDKEDEKEIEIKGREDKEEIYFGVLKELGEQTKTRRLSQVQGAQMRIGRSEGFMNHKIRVVFVS